MRSIPKQIFNNVYQGSNFNASDTVLLKRLGITHIVDCCKNPSPSADENIKYFHISVDDADIVNCQEYFQKAFDFLCK